MPRGGQKSYIQQMKEDQLRNRGGDPNKRGKPLQGKDVFPKQAKKLPSERKGYNV
jgi:hypothetical protein